MKKKLYFLPLLAALALIGCTKEESENGGGSGSNGEQYLAISIVSNAGGGSRADSYDPDNNGIKYEDGTGAENTVNAVRLYFFSAAGDPVKVKKDALDNGNYYDLPSSAFGANNLGGANRPETVEQQINAFIMIDAGETLPAQVVAVINPPADLTSKEAIYKANRRISLPILRERVYDFVKRVKEESSFVMVNSVYGQDQKAIVATTIAPKYYKKSEEEAKKDPVVIYVERNVAKVRVGVSADMPKEGSLYKVYQKEKMKTGNRRATNSSIRSAKEQTRNRSM